MTVSTETTKITYVCDGATNLFPFSFPVGPFTSLYFFLTDPAGTVTSITADFNLVLNPPIDPNPTQSGGYVVFPASGSPLPVGFTFTIARIVPETQPTSLTNQSIMYPKVIEAALDYLCLQIQQVQQQVNNSLVLPINEQGPLVLPPCPERAGKLLGFDENCQPVAVTLDDGPAPPAPIETAIRVPVPETVEPLPDALTRGNTILGFDSGGNPALIGIVPPNLPPLIGPRLTLTATHAVVNAEKGYLFQLAGNSFYDLSLGDPSFYDSEFSIAVFNSDIYTGPGSGRAKRILFNGTIMPGGLLWPGQWVYIFRVGSTWVSNPRNARWKPTSQVTFFVDPVAGHDDGTTDGLAPGSQAVLTINAAVVTAYARLDYGEIFEVSGVIIQLAAGTYIENIAMQGATVGGAPVTIQGADALTDPAPWIVRTPAGSYGIWADSSASIILRGLRFNGVGAGAYGVVASRGSTVSCDNCTIGNFPGTEGSGLVAFDSSTLILNKIHVTGNTAWPVFVSRASTARLSGAWTVANSLTFSYFMVAEYASQIVGGTAVFGDPTDFTLTGGVSCVGIQFGVFWNSIGSLGAGVMNNFPGSVSGVCGGTPGTGTDSSMIVGTVFL
jgi:hypothetical protein